MSYGDSPNPYDAPESLGKSFGSPDPQAESKVMGPAIGLMVTAGLGIALGAIALVLNVLGVGLGAAAGQGEDAMPLMLEGGIGIVQCIIGIALGLVVFFGAMKMKNLESYNFAMASAIIALVPCTSPCCLLGLPIGIWALVVLNDPAVKSSFR